MKYGLNDEQWAAVSGRSPIFVNASAGAGKTRCLVAKIQYLLDSGVKPENICAITFTNKAAEEMRNRLKNLTDVTKMQISTIHSMSVRIIKAFVHATRLKIPFTIYDDSDQNSIVKTIVKSKELPGNPFDYLSDISRCKGEDTVPTNPDVLTVYEQYQEILKTNNACDFDDLLIFARDCLKTPSCQEYFLNKWHHILVDEVQDTSKIQYQIITSMYDPARTKTFFLVGDVNQSIYGWRSARPQNIKDFIRDYNAEERSLTYNYRSCGDVINHANSFLQYGKPMVAKAVVPGKVSITEFSSLEREAEDIGRAIQQMGNFKETAIIYRINTRSLLFEQTFARLRIPYKVVNSLPFYQRRVTKDLLAALKASNNPDDRESLARIINVPKRGFGDAKKEQLLLQGRSYVEKVADEMPAISSFLDLLDDIKGMNPSDAINEFLNRSGYRTALDKDSDIFMVAALQDMVVNFETVEDLILASTFLEKDSGEGVNLITAHGSKGLEFDRVFVVGVENELWPHKNSIDIAEEERLFYVACTRARKYLNISYSRNKVYRGTVIPNYPSPLFKKSHRHIMGRDYL